MGRFSDAERVLERSVSIREPALEQDHLDVAQSLYNLGNGYWMQGRYAEAEAVHLRALAIQEKTLAPDRIELAITLQTPGGL